ncbi:Aste57867_22906 [Aphanomyces stellatus]|uniref:Aste57867_22906 protein n=1 Tax=Aphanomyces stellatus TaxID=120398 RepID=A0A485LM06_9STRA|nr:hypothetical protein As57867_022835 [Aphanomyces stellatus]VFT99556.1 Aste57867_22906 [Aphanomyces stellatus]
MNTIQQQSTMAIDEVPDAQTFLDRTAQLRETDPIGTNFMCSIVVASMANNEPMRFWVLSTPATSFAFMSSRGTCLSPSMTAHEATALGHVIIQSVDTRIPRATGPRDAVGALCAVLCTAQRLSTTKLHQALHFYVLDKLRLPVHVPGRLRLAQAGVDEEVLIGWIRDFWIADGEPVGDSAAVVARYLKRSGLYLWEVDGVAVGFAGFGTPVLLGSGDVIYRIAPVYTPPQERRKGYATATTAALCQVLLDQHTGKDSKCHIMLNVDVANSAAIKAYQNVGFVHQSDAFSFAIEYDA